MSKTLDDDTPTSDTRVTVVMETVRADHRWLVNMVLLRVHVRHIEKSVQTSWHSATTTTQHVSTGRTASDTSWPLQTLRLAPLNICLHLQTWVDDGWISIDVGTHLSENSCVQKKEVKKKSRSSLFSLQTSAVATAPPHNHPHPSSTHPSLIHPSSSTHPKRVEPGTCWLWGGGAPSPSAPVSVWKPTEPSSVMFVCEAESHHIITTEIFSHDRIFINLTRNALIHQDSRYHNTEFVIKWKPFITMMIFYDNHKSHESFFIIIL